MVDFGQNVSAKLTVYVKDQTAMTSRDQNEFLSKDASINMNSWIRDYGLLLIYIFLILSLTKEMRIRI